MFYFNLYDYLITWLLYCQLIIIFEFIKLFFLNVHSQLGMRLRFAPRL